MNAEHILRVSKNCSKSKLFLTIDGKDDGRRPSALSNSSKVFPENPTDCIAMGKAQSKTKLSEEDVLFLEENTTMNRAKIMEWYNGFIKTNPSGQVDRFLYCEVYSSLIVGPIGQTEDMQELLFRTLDTDNSGTISFRELMLALCICAKGNHEQKLAWTFRLYDINGDGHIDFEEVKRVVSAVYSLRTEEDTVAAAKRFFDKFEKSEDGMVNQEEFMKALAEERNLVDILTQNGRCYQGIDL